MSDVYADTAEPNSVPKPSLENFAPITIAERIDALDILRGLALIGILLMNIEWFNRAMTSLGSQDVSLTGLDHAVGWLIRCFVEGKFYKLFALLFGMGFAVMLIRAKEAERPFGVWFTRRMLALTALGLLHMVFLWSGDILHDYGIAGLLLLGWLTLLQKPRFKKYDNPKSFFKLSVVWLSVPLVISVLAGIGFGLINDTDDLTTQWQDEILVAERVEAIKLANETLSQQKSEALAEATATELLVEESVMSAIKVVQADDVSAVMAEENAESMEMDNDQEIDKLSMLKLYYDYFDYTWTNKFLNYDTKSRDNFLKTKIKNFELPKEVYVIIISSLLLLLLYKFLKLIFQRKLFFNLFFNKIKSQYNITNNSSTHQQLSKMLNNKKTNSLREIFEIYEKFAFAKKYTLKLSEFFYINYRIIKFRFFNKLN